MVIWIIGLSGAGKTTLAQQVIAKIRQETPNVVLLDGDVIRETFGDVGYDIDGRKRNSERLVQMSKWLDTQGIHVVCAVLSLFPQDRATLRRSASNYYEVYIDAPLEDLQNRDVKGLYRRYALGETQMVAGLDLDFPIPDTADLTIKNNGSEDGLLGHAAAIARRALAT